MSRPSDAVVDRAREAIGQLLAGADATRIQIDKNVAEMRRLADENTDLGHRAIVNEACAALFEDMLRKAGAPAPEPRPADAGSLFERMSRLARRATA